MILSVFGRRTRNLAAIFAFGIAIFLILSSLFGLASHGRPLQVARDVVPRNPLEVTLKVDPDCQRYGRCDESFRSTFGSLTITSLWEKLSSPNSFTVTGNATFTWIPEAYPGWSPEKLSVACRFKDCDFPGWTSITKSRVGVSQVWTGNFTSVVNESSSMSFYPFDQHWVHLKFDGKDPQSHAFLSMLDPAAYDIEVSSQVVEGKTSNFAVRFATAGVNKNSFSSDLEVLGGFPSLSSHARVGSDIFNKRMIFDRSNSSDSESFVVSFLVMRRTPIALWMVVIPLALILLNTNLAFHWRENSPASRFGSSGLLTAVSLFFAARVFRPNVDYLVFTDVWFLLVFVIITINNVLLIWLFRYYKHRRAQKALGVQVKPAYFAENRLTLISSTFIFLLIASLCLFSIGISRTPEIPGSFLAGNTSTASMRGASAIKIIDQSSLSSDQGGFMLYSRH